MMQCCLLTVSVHISPGCYAGHFLSAHKVRTLPLRLGPGSLSRVLMETVQNCINCATDERKVFNLVKEGSSKVCVTGEDPLQEQWDGRCWRRVLILTWADYLLILLMSLKYRQENLPPKFILIWRILIWTECSLWEICRGSQECCRKQPSIVFCLFRNGQKISERNLCF